VDLRRLEVFASVYANRSFSKAAEEVLLTQPTVSGHIKTLEEELGVKLFDRLGRGVVPTRAADVLFDYAKRILGMVKEARAALEAFSGGLRGELVVGGSTIPGQFVLPAVVGRFRAVHPQVSVVLHISDTGGVVEKVLKGDVELGVVGAALNEPKVAFTPLMDDELVVICPEDHPLNGARITPQELVEHPFVMREPTSGTQMVFFQALEAAGVSVRELEMAARMGSTTALIQAVRSGVGLGVVSRMAVDGQVGCGGIGFVEVQGLRLTRRFYLATLKGRTHSPAAKAFIGMCMAGLDMEE